jgi:signal transduction histidine kinase
MNLFQNAVRYTPVRGRVTLSARSEAGSVLFSIVNTGDEIPAEDLSHLFERFYRLEKSRDRAHGGAGIGLAIVKQLIESAGGRVGVDSAAGLVRFWFSLPA